jgi:hypothetical protein
MERPGMSSGPPCGQCGKERDDRPRLIADGRPGGAFTLCGGCAHPFIVDRGTYGELSPDDYRYLRDQPQILGELRAWAEQIRAKNQPRQTKPATTRAAARGARREAASTNRSIRRRRSGTTATAPRGRTATRTKRRTR